ncbi:MAG: DUF1579 domain-containing protein [Burkholderiales bacterium]|nr:DUF1579 domain-containing protein [Burkholderiales bacterium]
MNPDDRQSARHDFDFLIGRWAVQHRRLRERLAGSTQWDTFSGSTTAWPLLDGQANVDDNLLELPSGRYRAASLRAFDPASDQWSIWWLDSRSPGALDTPVRGRFSAGEGRFFADDVFAGRPIRVRFLWSDITRDSCRWQQAFSADGGSTWETNWVMDFRRLA